MKRLAKALDTTPDDIIDWKIQEDQSYITLMNLSALAFLFFPILGIIVPLILWIAKKDKLKHVNEIGKGIINFQITWFIILCTYYVYFFTAFLGVFDYSWLPNLKRSGNVLILIPITLYLFNISIILINTYRVHKKKKIKYIPAIKILK